MAKIDLKFLDNIQHTVTSKVIISDDNLIKISITYESIGKTHCIYFDKSTAIKFAKTLRTEINKI